MRVGIIDLGSCCVPAIATCLRRTCLQLGSGCEPCVVREPEQIAGCERIVLAPAGRYAACAQALAGGMGQAIREHIRAGKPCLAVSLGMALLFDGSDQDPSRSGLGVLQGRVRALVSTMDPMSRLPARVPHVGWNRLIHSAGGHPITGAAGPSGTWMYFAHDQQVVPNDSGIVLATVDHGATTIVAAIGRDNVVGTQFRPELSHRAGIRVLVAFLG